MLPVYKSRLILAMLFLGILLPISNTIAATADFTASNFAKHDVKILIIQNDICSNSSQFITLQEDTKDILIYSVAGLLCSPTDSVWSVYIYDVNHHLLNKKSFKINKIKNAHIKLFYDGKRISVKGPVK